MSDPFELATSDAEEEEEELVSSGLKHTLYVVDVRSNMTAETEACTYLQQAFAGIASSFRDLLIKGTKEKAGVLLCGTGKSDVEPGTHVLLPLQMPSAGDIASIENIAVGTRNLHKEFEGASGKDALPLDNAMTAVLSAIRNYASDKDEVDVIIFTNDLNPCKEDKALTERVLKRVTSDFRSARHAFASVYLCSFGQDPPPGNFWRQVLVTDTEVGGLVFDPDAVLSLEGLSESLRRKIFQKRAYARIPFVVADGIEFCVGVYHNLKPMTKPTPKKVETRTNEVVKSEVHWICDETGEELGPHQIKTHVNYGGQLVPIDREETTVIKSMAPRGFRLLGFKPASTVPEENLKPALFIYPEEGVVQGSTTAFAALHAKMLELNRVAVVRGVMRERGDTPKLFLLVPVRGSDTADGGYQPEGMYAIQVPFADNLRPAEPAPPVAEAVPEDAIEAAAKMADEIKLTNFGKERVPNPVIQKMYAYIEAIALQREAPDWDDEKDDFLQPMFSESERWPAIKEALIHFQTTLGEEEEEAPKRSRAASKKAPAAPKSPAKRGRGRGGGAGAKRQRVKKE